MTERGKPVLPLDLQLGSTADDGDGAVALYWNLTSEPCRFFPTTGQDMVNRIDLLSLERGINDVPDVARMAAEMLAKELASAPRVERPEGEKGRLRRAWEFTREISVVASLVRFVAWMKDLIPFLTTS